MRGNSLVQWLPLSISEAAMVRLFAALPLLVMMCAATPGADAPPPGNTEIGEYFRRTTRRLADNCLAEVKTLDDWQRLRPQLRQQLFEMLGLWPLPEKADLDATITGTVDGNTFVVEKLQFQSRPGLYITANFYRPKAIDKPLPAILYLCGHGNVKKDGVSYGSKTFYQHHAAWFARHGYCCLILDTLQLGEIEGTHHGTYRLGQWWWVSRGYTPAGVEAWNCIRALDYLQTRSEVNPAKIGVTGRSGGGAYTWWTAALDDRPACIVPVAGITDLTNHVVDGCVEGHCDCMYMVNTYGWDFAAVAALAAPRPLLFSNTDKDPIFPLDGVERTHAKLKRIYQLHNAADKLGLLITEGPHKDMQDLQVPAFRWFARWLKGVPDEPVTQVADKAFEPKQFKVFTELPADQKNKTAHEWFVPTSTCRCPRARANGRNNANI
jgi:dienelactone hydrolase